MKLLVQEYLENHTFEDLIKEHGVYASFSKSGQKFSLNYDQIEAKENDPLAQECRGLILSCEDGASLLPQAIAIPGQKISYNHLSPKKTKILAFPMRRFFNYGQGSAVEINWSDPKLSVLEKLDGTLIICYYDPFINQWCVATRSVPEADLLMDNGLFTFRSLFEKAYKETTGFDFISDAGALSYNKNYTYCFELCTPYNRIVVNYTINNVTLLSIRDNNYFEELNPQNEMKRNLIPGISVVKSYNFTNVDDLVNWVSTLNPMDHEGVVVRDENFNRIKIKNANYVAYNKCRDTLASSERNCLELILAEKEDDVIPFLPEEIVKNLQKIKSGLQQAIKDHDLWYEEIFFKMKESNLSDKKSFALLVNELSKNHPKNLWTASFFNRFDNKSINMKDFIQKNRKNGTWGDSFLDKLLDLSKYYF